MITSKKSELDAALESVIGKIDKGVVTCEDINALIGKTIIGETTPESVRDRVRRRMKRNETDSHIDNPTGHQPLKPPTFTARVQPKRAPLNQQSHGRANIAHDHSARTQERTMSASLKEAKVPDRFVESLQFIVEHSDKAIGDVDISPLSDRYSARVLATKLMNRPGVDRDWLSDFIKKLS